MKICKACGKPIKVNKDLADVLEGMHWLCFHLLFEHDNYDPDEPCDDPSCPWNKISGQSTHIINNYCDLKFVSQDRIAGIFLSKKSIESERLPSIEFELSIIDELLRGYKDLIWIEVDELVRFKSSLTQILSVGYGNAYLEAMSPSDFSLEIESLNRCGHMAATYKISGYKKIEGYNKPFYYQNTQQFEFNQLNAYINHINKVLKVFK
ncbi:hypothetical protein [Wukongibacter baidiensis]